MIQIKAVDAQNLRGVCELTTGQDSPAAQARPHSYRNAISIAQTKYCPDMHPNAIYYNHVLVGFFLYERAPQHAETATIRRFMIDDRFQNKGLARQALSHILRGLKIQGVKHVRFFADHANENARALALSLGFRFAGTQNETQDCYGLEWDAMPAE